MGFDWLQSKASDILVLGDNLNFTFSSWNIKFYEKLLEFGNSLQTIIGEIRVIHVRVVYPVDVHGKVLSAVNLY